MTVTERDLFLAILAMDSYNRGYGAGLNDGGVGYTNGLGGAGSHIGTATVTQQSDVAPGTPGVAAGFYAVAYNTEYGTVVSYRGTDSTPANDLATDANKGRTLGGGNFFAEQATLSVKFLDAVQADNAPGSVILTGQPLDRVAA
jgi:hypothetical protein